MILLAALPVWFPWLLSALLPGVGANIGNYERQGWGGFAISELVYETRGVKVMVAEAKGRQPLALLFDRMGGDKSSPGQVLVADGWTVKIKEADTSASSSSIRSVPDVAELVDLIASSLQDWIPDANLSNGTITGTGYSIQIPNVIWRDGLLELSAVAPEWGVGLDGSVDVRSAGTTLAKFKVSPEPVELEVTLTGGTTLEGNVHWLSNRVDISGEFDRERWSPETLTIVGRDLKLPTKRFDIEGYQDIRGELDGQFDGDRLRFDVHALAEPYPDRIEELETANAEFSGAIDVSSLWIEKLDVQTPALAVVLSNSFEVDLGTLAIGAPASLSINADIEKLPFLTAQGVVSGEVTVVPDDDRIPDLAFTLRGESLAAQGVEVEKVFIEGQISENVLELIRLEARDSRGMDLRATGRVALDPVEIGELSGELRASRGFIQQWLPDTIDVESVRVSDLMAKGKPQSLAHSGRLEIVRGKVPSVRRIDAEVLWEGQGLDSISADLGLVSGDSSIKSRFAIDQLKRIHLGAFTLVHGSGPELTLVSPATADVAIGADGEAEITVDRFEISDGADVSMGMQGGVSWPNSGDLRLSARGLRPSLISGFIEPELPDASVNSFAAVAAWDDGPVRWELKTDLAAKALEGTRLRLDAEVSGGREGMDVARLVMTTEGENLVEASGVFPLAIVPSDEERPIRLPEDGDVSGRMSLNVSDQIVALVERLTSIRLSTVNGVMSLGGTVSEPFATLHVESGPAWIGSTNEASRVRIMDELRIDSSLSPVELSVTDAALKLGGDVVALDGTLPMSSVPTGGWSPEAILAMLGEARLSISMPRMSVSQLDSFLPAELKREGTVSLQLRLKPGEPVQGEFVFSDLSTLPLPGLGSIRDIGGRLLVADGQAVLEEVSCQLGSRTANITGSVEVNPEKLLAGTLPRFDLRLAGEEIPLVRDTGMIIRSDLDITLKNDGTASPIVGGEVNLRRSFFRSELDLLAFNDVSVPAMKPPFFSIADPPLNEWRFDLRIRGDRFMIVRSPIFKGVVSANLQLQGDFEEPQLLGDIVIPQGTLTFPFANLYITRAMITATTANPNDPRLLASAISRISDYSITMNASGSLSDPVITFSSSPPLTSKEILLLISAGKMPARTDDLSTSDRMGKLAVFLGKDLINKFGTGEPTEDRWVVRSGERTSTAGKPTYYIEYLVTDDWSLVGEYDEYDAVNAGVKWRLLGR